jgi:hypothetical protein
LGRENAINGSISAPRELTLSAYCTSPSHKRDDTTSIYSIIQEGVRSLFKGLSASLLSVSNAVVYFYIY